VLVYINVYAATVSALFAVIAIEEIFIVDPRAPLNHALKIIALQIVFIKKHFVDHKNTPIVSGVTNYVKNKK
jgi:hypothetical protein